MNRIIYLAIFASIVTGCGNKYKLFQDENIVTRTGEKKSQGLIEKIFPKKQEKILDLPTDKEQGSLESPIDFKYSSKIIPGDELHIDIFNKSKIAKFEDVANTDLSGVSYVVDGDGTIFLPLLGEVNIVGLNTKEASQILTNKYKRYLNKPYVKVKLKSTRIYVLGEVATPGMLPIPPSGVSIFEVLAKSGDFTDYAQKDDVLIISGNLGKQTIRSIDLTSMKSINNTDLIIKPNSIVYVTPRSMKEVKVNINDISPILSIISSTLGTFLSIDYIANGGD